MKIITTKYFNRTNAGAIRQRNYSKQKQNMTLFLILTGKWFDMIASGQKKEEYRQLKPYWAKRLNKPYDKIVFQHGYSKDARRLTVVFEGIEIKLPKPEWSEGSTEPCYAIKLGPII